MENGADDAGQDDLPVLEAVDPAVVEDGDELDDDRSVVGAHADDTTKPTDLKDDDDRDVGEVTKEGDRDGTEGDGSHPQVGEQGQDRADVRVNLGTVRRKLNNFSSSFLSILKRRPQGHFKVCPGFN